MSASTQSVDMPGTGEITRLLAGMSNGDPTATEELLSRIYHQLRALAASKLAHEAPGQTLQATDLVHEMWLRLMGNGDQRFPDRAYFFAAAGEAMRRILVENARRKKRLKHGGNLQKVDIEEVDLPAPLPEDELLALHEALTRFAESEPRAAELVKLRFFVGLTREQAAEVLGVSVATVDRQWAFARAWLFREIEKSQRVPI
jgi:RNA polymerase sigma factor (TIGR02999 family)